MTEFQPLDVMTLPLSGSALIEASAGTGKTWTLAALYVRLVLGHGNTAFPQGLAPQQLLVLTFTRAATRELRERIRARLADSAELLRRARVAEAAGNQAELGALIDAISDPFLRELLTNCDSLELSHQRCNLAAQSMDQAAIYTINSFCQRALKRFAFAAGHAFEQPLQTDTSELKTQILNDYWRRFIQPLPASVLAKLASYKVQQQLIKVPLATPAALGKAIHEHKIVINTSPQQAPLPAAIEDAATLLTQTSAAMACARAALADQRQAFNDWLGAQLEDSNLSRGSYKEKPFNSLTAFIDAGEIDTGDLLKFTPTGFKWNKNKAQPLPAALNAPQQLAQFLELHAACDDFPLAPLLQQAADWMAVELDKRLDQQDLLTFDTMVTHLAEALADADGQLLADQLFAAWPCALIDEFQDTDRHQYRIFQQIYQSRAPAAHAWLMIGDPKQSIYRFRGADIDTYLAASQQVDQRYTLGTNFRSSKALVAACNRLFLTSPLEQQGDGVFGVDGIRYRAVAANGSAETLQLDNAQLAPLTLCSPPQGQSLAAGNATAVLADHFAARVAQLLQASQQAKAWFVHHKNASKRALQANDIACLVRTGDQAKTLKHALAKLGVDAVFISDKSSVFESSTAIELCQLLRAIAAPSDGRLARQALASSLLAYDSDTLVLELQQEDRWLAHLQQLRQLHLVWQQQGVLPMLHRFVHLLELPQRQRDERVLTDFFHLAELLQQASITLDGMEALIAWLQAAIAGRVDDEAKDSDMNDQQLRLENERKRVIIMTLHGSKGLEFPLVMLPFACIVESENKRDDPAEDMRLLYVGITRAVHACWLGLIPCRSGNVKEHQLEHNCLGQLLFGGAHLSDDEMRARLQQLQQDANGLIRVDTEHAAAPFLVAADSAPETLALPPLTAARKPQHWSVSSFSRLARGANRAHFSAASERLLESMEAGSAAAAPLHASIHEFARGREAGNLLHGLLEKLCLRGFANQHHGAISQLLEQQLQERQWQDAKPLLADWLTRLIHTPLPLQDANVTLAQVNCALPESEFWLRLQHSHTDALEQLAQQLLPGERPALNTRQLNGMLKGFIDLLFEHDGRYYVLDYKSNHLGADAHAYTQEAMQQAMLDHRYELQGLIYQLALHRLLRLRLPDYDPERHLGGSLFFFLRGIDSASRGLFHLAAAPELLEQLDALFDDAQGACA